MLFIIQLNFRHFHSGWVYSPEKNVYNILARKAFELFGILF